MGIKIKWETAENMMNIVAFVACQSYAEHETELDLDAVQNFARSTFEDYCRVMGITEVEDPEDEDEDEDFDDDEEDEEDGEAEMESIIYPIGGHRGISEEDAHLLVECVAKNIREEFSSLPDDIVALLIKSETLRIAKEWDIEVVDAE